MKREGGQIEISMGVLASIATALALVVSIVTSCSIGAMNYGRLDQKVTNMQTVFTAQQEKVNKIPALEDKLSWVMERLDQIADKVGAPAAKE